MKTNLLFLCILSVVFFARGQADSKWILGETLTPDSILAFNFSNGQVDTVKYNIHLNYFMSAANICDANGNLMCATNGLQLVNAKGHVVPGSGNLEGNTNNPLRADALPTGCIILPIANTQNRYLLLHEPDDEINSPFLFDEQPLHLYYSVVDMGLNNGEGGAVPGKVSSPIIADTLVEGRLAACRHANGRDWWVLAHKYYARKYYRVLIQQDSVVFVEEQTIGSVIHYQDYNGQAAFSLDGTKYAMVGFVDSADDGHSGIELYDFDRCTGLLSNLRSVNMPMAIPNQQCPGGCSFSPNGRFLYASSYNKLYQYDLQLDELLEIIPIDSPRVTAYLQQQQLAPDGKIYITSTSSRSYIQTISNPDIKGQGCNLKVRGYELTRWNGTFPAFSNFNLGALAGSECDTIQTTIKEAEQKEKLLKIFPNPATNFVTVDYGFTDWNKGEVSLEITNELGQLVHQQPVPMYSGFQKVEVQNFAPGMYTAFIKRKEQVVATAKFAKQ